MLSAPGTLFARHPVFRSADAEEVERALGEVFLPLELRPEVDVGPMDLDAHLNAIRVGRLTAGFLSFNKPVRIRTVEAASYHVDIPVAGNALMRTGLREAVAGTTATAAVFMPGLPADISCEAPCGLLCLMLPREELHLELANLLGHEADHSLDFATSFDLATPAGAAFMHALMLVELESRRPAGLLGHPLAAQRLEQVLLYTLLLAQPHNYTDELLTPRPAAKGGPVAEAVDLLRANPERPWTVGSLAAAVSVSVRSLQEGFRRTVGRSPMAYLRELRLDLAREQLLAARPGSVSVTQVAMRWGFTHHGRFAASYHRKFGQRPAETLRTP
jgi:AraC-like DNA-binding protein